MTVDRKSPIDLKGKSPRESNIELLRIVAMFTIFTAC